MAVARLNYADRRLIASGLVAGLGSAEIARKLARPTSTVTREVNRNGGPTVYRADHAQQATERRARRGSRPSWPSPGVDEPAAADEFVHRFAATMVRAGLPRTAARALASLVTSDTGSATVTDLVHLLGVSPASISKAVNYLVGLGVLRREREPDGRRERYSVDDDAWLRTWVTSARTTIDWACVAADGARLYGDSTPVGARLARMARFFDLLGSQMAAGQSAGSAVDAVVALGTMLRAGRLLSADETATFLGWPTTRVTAALDIAESACRHDAERSAEVP